ncbi:hypothetical protein GCM10023185_08690 [Hymenobacter saemangeumensis]|uniref:VPDSG-CTERM sorting domain-containing protein n=1 Tax=Hymenobacter saemangeumensis TaxID=1084522 RepID=A0ABP8I3K7_9BACT
MKTLSTSFLLLPALVLFLAGSLSAQPGGGPTPGGGNNPTPVPIDGGASLLLASGAALGLRKLRRKYRRQL